MKSGMISGRTECMIAWRYLRTTRANGGVSVVSIVSLAGITLAVMALIVIMSVMNGFRSTLLNAILGGQGHIFVYTPDELSESIDALADRIAALDDVDLAMPVIEQQALAVAQNRQSASMVRGVRMQDLDSLPFLPGGRHQARLNGFGTGKNGGDTVLIGRFLAAELQVRPGDRIKLIAPKGIQGPFGVTPRSKIYTVGTYFETGSVELDRLYILMPARQAQLFFSRPDRYDKIDVRVPDPLDTDPGIQAINELSDYRYVTQSWKVQRAGYFGALNTERSMMMIIMLILIMITSLNIITGVTMLVKNKTRDIAILRTIGLSRGSIMRIFMMTGGILGLTGALLGAGLGIAIILNISFVEDAISFMIGRPLFPPTVYGLSGLPAELNWGEVTFATLWAMAMSVLVTVWPAWAAARLDPVDALRFE